MEHGNRSVLRIGVLGAGPIAQFAHLEACRKAANAELYALCDAAEDLLERVAAVHPPQVTHTDYDAMLADSALDAVAIATPVATHATLAEQVLATGKHCFVEKPLAQNSTDAERLVEAAADAGRVLMVGHLLEYHPGLEMLGDMAAAGELGDIHYIYGNRLNLGKLRADENALWSLGAHDVSVLLRLTGEEPCEVQARGGSYMRESVEECEGLARAVAESGRVLQVGTMRRFDPAIAFARDFVRDQLGEVLTMRA